MDKSSETSRTEHLLSLCDCTSCPLAVAGLPDSTRGPVFGSGNRNAKIVIVGEAPGRQEVARNEPFIGPSGQLLDAMLNATETQLAPMST
jgi:uracil-DNA glycosylase family 4